MVVRNLREYENKAVELATNRELLNKLRDAVETSRLDCPLFDAKRWTRNFEAGLRKIVERYDAGLPPDHIWVKEEITSEGESPKQVQQDVQFADLDSMRRNDPDIEANGVLDQLMGSQNAEVRKRVWQELIRLAKLKNSPFVEEMLAHLTSL
jgi:hypothetical protein